jgi:hypothetical protein
MWDVRLLAVMLKTLNKNLSTLFMVLYFISKKNSATERCVREDDPLDLIFKL